MSVVAAYHVFVCTLFPVEGDMWTKSTYLLHWKQCTHKYMICCHNTH